MTRMRRTFMSVEDILVDLRKDQEATEMRWAALTEAIATFERLKNRGRKPRGRPRGASRKTDRLLAAQAAAQTS
jgi:hypothetical protein